MKRIVIAATAALFAVFAQSATAQKDEAFSLTLIQPGAFVIFDTGTDDAGEVDLYTDGEMEVTVSLLSLDWWPFRWETARLGASAGLGLSEGVDNDDGGTGALAVFNVGAVLELANVARLQFGVIHGHSAKEVEDPSLATDTGIYLGFSFPTVLGDVLAQAPWMQDTNN